MPNGRNSGRNTGSARTRKKKGMIKGTVLLIDLLLVALLAVSLVMLTVEAVKYVRARKTYANVQQAVTVTENDPAATALPEAEADPATDRDTPEENPTASSPEAPAERRLSTEPGISVNWEELAKDNKQTRAWLYCSGTIINYPVVYPDDNEYYIDHDFYGKEDDCGALFFDCRTNFNAKGAANWIVYGHRRNDRSMFGMLSRWGNDSFRERYPVMYLITPEHSYRVELFACRTVRAETKYFTTYFDTEEEFAAYVDKALSQSYWTTDVEVGPDDIILTMVTCNKYSVTTDPRLLLHGKLVALD